MDRLDVLSKDIQGMSKRLDTMEVESRAYLDKFVGRLDHVNHFNELEQRLLMIENRLERLEETSEATKALFWRGFFGVIAIIVGGGILVIRKVIGL